MKSSYALLPVCGLLLSMQTMACESTENLAPQLSVSDITLDYSQPKDTPVVTVLGTVKNTSTSTAQGLLVEAKLLDSQGKPVDVITDALYDLVVPANESIAFRLQSSAAKTKESYATAQVRIISADAKCKPKPKAEKSELKNWLYVLLPALLFIGFWSFLIQRAKRQDSPQERTLKLIEQQNALMAQQVQALEKIVLVIENKQVSTEADKH